ncbi:MAG TPA: heme o synthase [Verrucomicrobiae bacterium]|jgi:protoheme IX farnesyltransferase|nr:heme o synthase [Verrucomicrobiae bacterium]
MMKATAQTLDATPTLAKAPATEKALPVILSELFKMRLTGLVLLTTLVGFYLGSRGPVSWVLMFHTVFGTALLASGAAALNQLIEREHDAKMRRTQDRPLPSGRLTPESVLIIGGACGVIGMIYLALTVNLVTAALGAATLGSYVFVYTPLKRITTLNTVIGAIPGGLPPLMGWTAARGEISGDGWSLFAILCFWQLPHFLAIAWMYKDEYAKAGFVMLPVVDHNGERTGRQALCHTLGLLPISLCPFIFHMVGPIYLAGAFLLGISFVWCAFQFSRKLTLQRARVLFFASIIYLPLLLSLMVIDKVRS